MTEIFIRRDQLEKRCTLRAERPMAEQILWQGLRGRRLGGYKFRRQYSVGPYVLGFYCPGAKLAIEVDGPTHDEEEAARKDAERRQFIESLGIRFFRCANDDVYHNLKSVLIGIAALLLAADAVREEAPMGEGRTPP